jgi:hypothetical protein
MVAITYKPVSERVYGLAKVKVGQKKAKISWIGEDAVTKTVSLDAFPDLPVLKTGTEKNYYVVYNSSTDEVESVGPESGLFRVRCVDMSRPEAGADPEPIEGQSFKQKDGKEKLSFYFKVWLKILDKAYKGVLVPMNLGYKFQRANDGTTTFTADPTSPKATAVRKVYEFLELTGVLDGDEISWDDNDGNVLPEILGRILAEKREFSILIKEGKIAELLAADDEEDTFVEEAEDVADDDLDDEDEVDKDFPKKSVKPAKVEEEDLDEL